MHDTDSLWIHGSGVTWTSVFQLVKRYFFEEGTLKAAVSIPLRSSSSTLWATLTMLAMHGEIPNGILSLVYDLGRTEYRYKSVVTRSCPGSKDKNYPRSHRFVCRNDLTLDTQRDEILDCSNLGNFCKEN